MANDYKYAMEIDRAREKALRYLKAELKYYQESKENGKIYIDIKSVIGGMERMLDIFFDTHSEVDKFGRKYRKAVIMK